MAEKALDIFDILRNIDIKNHAFYDSLNDEQRKAFVPFVVMQWMACTEDDFQIIMLNEFVNKVIFSLHKHPRLLYKLLCCCSSGRQQYYKWAKQNKTVKYPKATKLLLQHLQISNKRLQQEMHLISNDEILMLACDYGYQKEEFAELQKELKNRP